MSRLALKTVLPTLGAPSAGNRRAALFISHANPEDNAFTIWLGAKLSALGYEVWADVFRLKGGEDWQRELEHALRSRAYKVLLVANAKSVNKQGVRNEIQIAHEVAKLINDRQFVIPLRLAPYNAPFLIAHAQYIDFSAKWSEGLNNLLQALDEKYKVPRASELSASLWSDLQQIHARSINDVPELLLSNWLRIDEIPKIIRYYNFKGGIHIDKAKERIKDAPWPTSPYRRGFFSFASLHDLQDHFGTNFPLLVDGEIDTFDFIESGWNELQVRIRDSRNHFSNLSRQATENMFTKKGLVPYGLSGQRTAWWAPIDTAPSGKIAFHWGQIKGLRKIHGESIKRSMHWHFGISFVVYSRPVPHVRLINRLIFTTDGSKPIDSQKRMHRLRRSIGKNWRNARWRDVLLAFLHWVSEGEDTILVPVSGDKGLRFGLPPMSWLSPVSIDSEPQDTAVEIDDIDDDGGWLAADYFTEEECDDDEG